MFLAGVVLVTTITFSGPDNAREVTWRRRERHQNYTENEFHV